MSFKFSVLASGSKGNATVLSNGDSSILIDCGISCKQACLRMEKVGVDPATLKAIIVTHEHSDHTKGIRVLSNKTGACVMATKGTFQGMENIEITSEKKVFSSGRTFVVSGFEIRPFDISHDANEPVGMVVKKDNCRLGIATDLGHATTLVRARLANCQGLILESNHDLNLLSQSRYPEWLKQRVRSKLGHLSNEQGAELLSQLHHADLACVVLGHLSENTNLPDLAARAGHQVLEKAVLGTRLIVANQNMPTDLIKLS